MAPPFVYGGLFTIYSIIVLRKITVLNFSVIYLLIYQTFIHLVINFAAQLKI
jgi:hypothetical protein